MNTIYQQTVNKLVSFEGVGLHSGKISKVKILQGKDNEGIVFKRVDLKNNNLIKANFKNVTSAKLCTTLGNSSGHKVSTVEHLLAAFYIVGIDNAIVEINNEEMPIMDGSSKEFVQLLTSSGIKVLNKKRKYLKILNKIELEDEKGKNISIEPNNFSFEVDFKLNYENKIIGNQQNKINFLDDNLEQVYSSRTFCLFQDIEKIKKCGFAKGGSLDNAIVVDQKKILNKDGLRNKKEFVNHKILDLAGDFLLSGYRIFGKVNCFKGGHLFSNKFLKKMLKSEESYVLIEMTDIESTKKSDTSQSIKIAVNA